MTLKNDRSLYMAFLSLQWKETERERDKEKEPPTQSSCHHPPPASARPDHGTHRCNVFGVGGSPDTSPKRPHMGWPDRGQ